MAHRKEQVHEATVQATAGQARDEPVPASVRGAPAAPGSAARPLCAHGVQALRTPLAGSVVAVGGDDDRRGPRQCPRRNRGRERGDLKHEDDREQTRGGIQTARAA